MTTKIIPQAIETYCDGCGALCHDQLGPGRRKQRGVLALRRHALDFHDQPVASADVRADLCDECLTKIIRAINMTLTEKVPAEVKGATLSEKEQADGQPASDY
jgi:uncharacterized cysteine cluster protein YcgN (CxxCxxCC family)